MDLRDEALVLGALVGSGTKLVCISNG